MLSFKSITASRGDKSYAPIDFDSLNTPLFEAPAIYENKQFSQEFQLTFTGQQWQGVAGLYYMKANAFNEFDVLYNAFGGTVAVYRSTTNVTDAVTVSGCTIQHGVMFGPGMFGFGIDRACKVAAAAEDNYGETVKVVWIAYEGSGVLDNTFCVGVHTD